MGRTEANFWAFAQWRAESLVETRKTILMSYRHSVEVGDVHYALYSGINGGEMLLSSGEHLDDMEPIMAQIYSTLRNMKALGSAMVESSYGILRCFKVLPNHHNPRLLPPSHSFNLFIMFSSSSHLFTFYFDP